MFSAICTNIWNIFTTFMKKIQTITPMKIVPEGQLCLRRIFFWLNPKDWYSESVSVNMISEIRSMCCVCSPAAHAFKPIKSSGKPQLSLPFSLIFWHLSSMSRSSHQIHSLKTRQNHVEQKSSAAETVFHSCRFILRGFNSQIIKSSASLADAIESESFNPPQNHSSTVTG